MNSSLPTSLCELFVGEKSSVLDCLVSVLLS